MADGSPESLARHLEWLYGKGGVYRGDGTPCRCEHAYRPLGRLYGVNMGMGWVRTTTHPYCVHHGDKAQADWDRRHGRRKGRQEADSGRNVTP